MYLARDTGRAREHLAKAHGLYIPGGQDATKDDKEKVTGEAYEQALIARARNSGLPTLGICGGSRCLARGFGAPEEALSGADLMTHNQKGTAAMAHSLTFPDPSTILGGAALGRKTVDAINSTHQKIVAYERKTGELSHVNRLTTDEPELTVSARSPEGHPEGFETTHGAPIVGVTSHPEAIHGASSAARKQATPQGRDWSDRVFKGFEQSMKAYAGRQQVNEELTDIAKRYREYYPNRATLQPGWEPYNEEDTVDYAWRDYLRNFPK